MYLTLYPSRKVAEPQDFQWPKIQWKGRKLPSDEHNILIQLAHLEYQWKWCQKVFR